MINTLRSLLFKDFWLKLVSLALAILVYALVSARNRPQAASEELMDTIRTFADVPVKLVSSRADVQKHRCQPVRVSVTVQGTSQTIKGMDENDLHAMVDLSYWDPQRGEEQLVLVTTPPGTSPMQVKPATVKIIPPEQQP